MYRKNDQHRQQALFSSVNDLPPKKRQRLEASWAGTFYTELFCRIDEDLFAVLYSDEVSRPNAPDCQSCYETISCYPDCNDCTCSTNEFGCTECYCQYG